MESCACSLSTHVPVELAAAVIQTTASKHTQHTHDPIMSSICQPLLFVPASLMFRSLYSAVNVLSICSSCSICILICKDWYEISIPAAMLNGLDLCADGGVVPW